MRALSVLSRGTLDEKLEWLYRLYDNKDVGYISWDRLYALISSINDMIGSQLSLLFILCQHHNLGGAALPAFSKNDRVAHTHEIFQVMLFSTLSS